jgi:hypothetical protein
MPRILDFNSRETYRSINNLKPNLDPPDRDIPAFMGGDFDKYPWLRVPGQKGCTLYVSCAMNGNMSAGPLISYLATQKKLSPRKITIVSGRHGRECGNQLAAAGSALLHPKARDTDGIAPDQAALDEVARALKKSSDDLGRVVPFDDPTLFPDGHSAMHLKAGIKKCFDAGEDVILAWCYSLSSMHDAVYTEAIQSLVDLDLHRATLINQDIAFANPQRQTRCSLRNDTLMRSA